MHIVEYLDNEGKPSGQYAKRFEDGIEEIPIEVDTMDPETNKPHKLIIINKRQKFRDEVIPKKILCVCDSFGNIKSMTEVRFSYAMEVEGKSHCMELKIDEECHPVAEEELAVAPKTEKDKLTWIINNCDMDKATNKIRVK